MMAKNIILHCGAHKTATSYVQQTLLQSKEALELQGIAYVSLATMRSGLTASIINLKKDPSQVLNMILDEVENKNFKTLIISDENILGSTNDILKHKKIAPFGALRLDRLQAIFKDYRLMIFLTIRNPKDYISSVYCEYLRTYKYYISFRKFIKNFDYLSFHWYYVVNDLLKYVYKEQLYVFSYDYFRENEDLFFQKFIGDNIDCLDKVQNKKMRSSYSNKTVEIIDHLAVKFNHHFVIRFLDHVEHKIINLEKDDRFDPWSDSEKRLFNSNYLHDLAELKKLLPNSFLT